MITQHRIDESDRANEAHKLFSIRFYWLESFVFDTAGSLSSDYDGGFWDYFLLSSNGFYMVPTGRPSYLVQSANGFEGAMSAEAFGITACLYAYSLLSFSPDSHLSERCAAQFHLLREFALDHAEARAIFAATD